MGMFDREPNLTSEGFINEPFELLSGEYIGHVKSPDYGNNQKARVTVRIPATGEEATFSVYGVLADQIGRMDGDDLPATVRIEKQGNANVFVPANGTASGADA